MPSPLAVCRHLVPFIVAASAAVVFATCGPPQLPTGPGGMTTPSGGSGGEYQCKNVSGKTDPWLVEWQATQKARMQAATQSGVLLVRYSGCELEVLYGCEQKGEYTLVPTTPSASTEYITNEGDVFAKLPIGALNLAAEYEQGDRWSLDYVIVGMRQTKIRPVRREDLSGECARATHFISGMAVGAYRLVSEARRKLDGGVTVYGAGAGASSGATAGTLRQDGKYDLCNANDASASDARCQAIVQLFLEPVEPGGGSADRPNTAEAAATTLPEAPADPGPSATVERPEPTVLPEVPQAPEITWTDGGRFGITRCGSIVDSSTDLEWLVGPDVNTSWEQARDWVGRQNACGGGWRMPTIIELKTLFDKDSQAGVGFYLDGKRYPAKIHPVFSGIGEGSWVWSSSKLGDHMANAMNFYTGNPVALALDGADTTPRAFAVR